jgi:Uma2 family endonuclease
LFCALQQALASNENCLEFHLVYEIDWHVDAFTVLRPDLLILCGEPPEDFVKRPPVFIAEILSPSTAEKDRTFKRMLYEANGVRSYLLGDPEARTWELLTLDGGGRCQSAGEVVLELHDGCRITLDLASCFA